MARLKEVGRIAIDVTVADDLQRLDRPGIAPEFPIRKPPTIPDRLATHQQTGC